MPLTNYGEFAEVNVADNATGDRTVIAAPVTGQSIRVAYGWLYNNAATEATFTIKSGSTTKIGPITLPAKGFLPLRGESDDYAFSCAPGEALVVNTDVASSLRGFLNVHVR